MIPSVSMWSLEAVIQKENWKQEDFLNWASKNNIPNVELVSYYMDKENSPEKTAAMLIKLGLKTSCYTILSDFTDSSDYSDSDLKKDLDTAAILKAPYVRVITGDNQSANKQELKKIIKKLDSAAELASQKDIVLVLENIGSYADTADNTISIIKEVGRPELKINFDTANSMLYNEEPDEALEKMLPYTAFVHLKDFITEDSKDFSQYSSAAWRIQSGLSRKMTGIIAGQGEAGLDKVMKRLKAAGYKGYISVEYENDIKPAEAVLESLNFLSEYL